MNKINKNFKVIIIFAIFFFFFLNRSYSENCNQDELKIYINQSSFYIFNVEIAKSEEELKKGLMYRKSLEELSGMLFIFDEEGEKKFWMKNTFIPLDILFIDKNGTIKKIEMNTIPLSEKLISGGKDTMYVLELNAGITEKFKIEPGHFIFHTSINKKNTECHF